MTATTRILTAIKQGDTKATGQSGKAAEWNKQLTEFDRTAAGKKTAVPKP